MQMRMLISMTGLNFPEVPLPVKRLPVAHREWRLHPDMAFAVKVCLKITIFNPACSI